MEMRARTYSYLEKTMNEQELDKFACDIATSYATSEGQYSRRYYTKIYNITSDCFYKLLERAIVRDLVLDEIVDKMRQKAYKNSNTKSMEKSGKNTVTSHIHYAKMIGERKWFKFLRDFPKNEKIEIYPIRAGFPAAMQLQRLQKGTLPARVRVPEHGKYPNTPV